MLVVEERFRPISECIMLILIFIIIIIMNYITITDVSIHFSVTNTQKQPREIHLEADVV